MMCLRGNVLSNTIAGGAGNDRYFIDASVANGSDIFNETSGEDGLIFEGSVGVNVNLALTTVQSPMRTFSVRLNSATGFENLFGTDGNDTLTGNTLAQLPVG